MRYLKVIVVLFCIIGFNSCKEDQKVVEEKESVVSTFYFIRHAEKDKSDPKNADPELNQDGLGRAIFWAEVMDPVPLDAIYTTNYARTSMTAAPTAVKKDITVQYYDPRNINVEEFKEANLGKTVLVVGHSNTTPDFVNKMIDEKKFKNMDHTDNGSLFMVRIIDGKATHIRLNISTP